MTEPTPTEPIANVNLAELFSRDPLHLSEQDIDTIILELRKSRAAWQADEVKAKTEGKATRSKVAKAPKLDKTAAAAVSVDDLLKGLQI